MNGAGSHGDGGEDLRTSTARWMTPRARDYRGIGKDCLPEQIESFPPPPATTTHGEPSSQSTHTSRRRLNPAFVCWLMGLNWWWTRAEPISFAAAEMESYRSRLRWHFENLCGEQEVSDD